MGAGTGLSLLFPGPGASRCQRRDARTLYRAGARAGLGSRNGATAWLVLRVKGLPSSRLSSQVHPWVGPPLVSVSALTLPQYHGVPLGAPMLRIPGGALPACPPDSFVQGFCFFLTKGMVVLFGGLEFY